MTSTGQQFRSTVEVYERVQVYTYEANARTCYGRIGELIYQHRTLTVVESTHIWPWCRNLHRVGSLLVGLPLDRIPCKPTSRSDSIQFEDQMNPVW